MQAELQRLGAEVVLIPAIEIKPRTDLAELDQALRSITEYAWIVFTSVNGVRITWDRVQSLELGAEALQDARIAAIGPATARALRQRGLEPDFVPEEFVAEKVAAGIPQVEGVRILLPRAAGARPVLPQQLEARGAQVNEIAIYESVRGSSSADAQQRLREGVDALTFTSPSTAENFTAIASELELAPETMPGDPVVACIGPITAQAARELGYHPDVVASRYTAAGLVEALTTFYQEGPADES